MTLNALCARCIWDEFHFFHDDGSRNEDPLTKAHEDCLRCLTNVKHYNHDTRGTVPKQT